MLSRIPLGLPHCYWFRCFSFFTYLTFDPGTTKWRTLYVPPVVICSRSKNFCASVSASETLGYFVFFFFARWQVTKSQPNLSISYLWQSLKVWNEIFELIRLNILKVFGIQLNYEIWKHIDCSEWRPCNRLIYWLSSLSEFYQIMKRKWKLFQQDWLSRYWE